MLHSIEIGVSSRNCIPSNEEGSHGRGGDDLIGKTLVNSRIEDGTEVTNESVGRTVLHPFVVRVDSATVLSASLAVGF